VIDPDAFAALLCDWCVEATPGQQVLIGSTLLAEPLVMALHRALLDRKAWPLLRLAPAELSEQFYRHVHDEHVDAFAPFELTEAGGVDASIAIDAPTNTSALTGIDPKLIARAAKAREPVREARLARRWAGTQWPTPALAQRAGMSEHDYAAFLGQALFLDQPDPAAAWQALSDRQQKIVDHLAQVDEIRIEADGTDLRLRVGARTWINSDGRRNMPSGEVFTGPHEDSANGTIRFTIPSSPRGAVVEGIELTFVDGRVTEARAERGDAYLQAALDTDGGARTLGELGIGTNRGIDRPTGAILLDEKMGGTVHLALGRSYPETGGTNASALHWDMICDLRDGGQLSGDGQVLNDLLWPVG
jgi:aminopeptidase